MEPNERIGIHTITNGGNHNLKFQITLMYGYIYFKIKVKFSQCSKKGVYSLIKTKIYDENTKNKKILG